MKLFVIVILNKFINKINLTMVKKQDKINVLLICGNIANIANI